MPPRNHDSRPIHSDDVAWHLGALTSAIKSLERSHDQLRKDANDRLDQFREDTNERLEKIEESINGPIDPARNLTLDEVHWVRQLHRRGVNWTQNRIAAAGVIVALLGTLFTIAHSMFG